MLEKRVEISNHFIRKFQRRARNHCSKPTYNNIKIKIKNLLSTIRNIDDLLFYKDTYFFKTKLSRDNNRPFYFIIKDNKSHFALVTIYTEDMFQKKYGSKFN